MPEPQPFPQFPSSALELLQIESGSTPGTLLLRCRLHLTGTYNLVRWHLSARIQLTAPGVGCNPGKMRSYMATRSGQNEIVFNVPNPGIEDYQVHLRYRLIDEVTGYRNNWLRVNSL